MERHEVPVRGEIEQWIEALERGDEVVLVREGKVVAQVHGTPMRQGLLDLGKLRALHAKLDTLGIKQGGGSDLIRQMREMDDH